MIWLKQSTASQEVPLGYFLDSTDGNTEETGLSIANTDIKLWKTGATTLANKNSGGATHISNGIYHTTLDATDSDTLGPMVIFVHVSGGLTVRLECLVLPANVYDSMVLGTDVLDVSIVELEGDGQSSLDLKDFADAGYDPATNKVTGVLLVDTTTTNTDLITAAVAAAAVWDLDATAHQTGGTFGQAIGDPGANAETMYDAIVTDAAGTNVAADVIAVKADTADMQPKLGTPDTDVSADIAAVKVDTAATLVDTAEIGIAGAGLTALSGMAPSMKAEILVEINAAFDAAISELSQGIPSATPSIRNAIMLFYMMTRNKLVVQTSGTDAIEVYNDAGTKIAKKTIADDTSDYTEDEMTSGA